jgi:hypothetical protein
MGLKGLELSWFLAGRGDADRGDAWSAVAGR